MTLVLLKGNSLLLPLPSLLSSAPVTTPLLNTTEKKQTGLSLFIPKAAAVKMQQHSSKDHTDTPGRRGGREGGRN